MTTNLLLGCIGDDFTGSTDLANTLVRNGMRTVQLLGVPDDDASVPDADAIVIALKSRTAPVKDAIAESRAARRWLQRRGAKQLFFKYCSTFDSTDQGNIGPVADALLDGLGNFSVACPAFPENKRTIYKGHLFVGDLLLSDSPMRNHPLTPMTDASLVRVLGRQTDGKVGLIELNTVKQGASAVRAAIEKLIATGYRYAILDATEDAHLMILGEACKDLQMITGGSGIALGLPENFRRVGLLASNAQADSLPAVGGSAAVIAGSCSVATLGQISYMQRSHPAFKLDPIKLANGEDQVSNALDFAKTKLAQGPVLIYASATPEEVKQAQQVLGKERASEVIETAQGKIAQGLVAAGVRKLVIAGGETSGAVVSALKVKVLQIGPQIDPGVPWTMSMGETKIALALKSGNFGSEDFFLKALKCIK
jgi:3-dehydrotetronate 4-kinase